MVRGGRTLALLGACGLVLSCGGCLFNSKTKKLQEQVNKQATIIAQLQDEKDQLQKEVHSLKAEKEQAAAAATQVKAGAEVDVDTLRSRLASAGVRSVKVVERENGRVAIRLAAGELFGSGRATLTSAAKTELARIARVLRSSYPGMTICVEGHTDSDPIRKSKYHSNWELANARAEAVLHYLVEKCAFPPEKIYTAGFAQYRPIADNATEKGKRLNRRVELVLIP